MATKISSNGGYTYNWTNPYAVYDGTDLWFTGINNAGIWRVFKNDTSSSLNYCDLDTAEDDDHNAPSLLIKSGKDKLVFYTRHNASQIVNYGKITVVSGQVTYTDLGNLYYPSNVTYTRALSYGDKIVLLTRSGTGKWQYRISEDWGANWGDAFVLLDYSEGNIYPAIQEFDSTADKYHIAMALNPANTTPHFITYGTLDMTTGDVSNFAGVIGNIYDQTNLPLGKSDFDDLGVVNTSGRQTRLLDVADKQGKTCVVYCQWDGGVVSRYYKAIQNNDGSWTRSTIDNSNGPLVTGAEFTPTSEAKHYIGGISFDRNAQNRLYISNEESGTWRIRKYELDSNLALITPLTLQSSTDKPLIRPIGVKGQTKTLWQEARVYNGFGDYTLWIWSS